MINFCKYKSLQIDEKMEDRKISHPKPQTGNETSPKKMGLKPRYKRTAFPTAEF
jgi:hypothetical protein